MAKKTMIIHCRCSNTGKPYEMVLEENPNGKGWTAVYTYAIKTMASNASGDIIATGPFILVPPSKVAPIAIPGTVSSVAESVITSLATIIMASISNALGVATKATSPEPSPNSIRAKGNKPLLFSYKRKSYII